MADRVQTTVLSFAGGIATDLAPQVRQLTFLLEAENATYEASGAIRKVGGGSRVNATAIVGSPDVLGMYDFWLSGTGGSSTQKFMATTSDSKVYKEDMDGVFDDITGAAVIGLNARPVFAQLTDLLTFWWSDASTPLKWNQVGNVASLAGTPPVARVAVAHANRMWAAGTNANPSRLFFSASGNIEDWTGADTGSIDIQPEDGDRILGLVSHKQRLLVFKGPNKGSVHEISGTAPTGGDAFTRRVLVRGIALQTHNSIVEVGDDVWFMSERGIHSISATERFGNFSEADLTRFLKKLFTDQIARGDLDIVWGVNYGHRSAALWTMSNSGSAEPDMVFGLSYIRLQEEGLKAFTWARGALSAAIRIHPTTLVREVVLGTTDGFVVRQDLSDRSLPGSVAYTFRALTPQVVLAAADSQGKPRVDQPVTLRRMYMKSAPVGNYDVTISLQRDLEAAEVYTFNQGQSGFILDSSLLDTGRLGGGNLQTVANELVGEARSVSLDITQGGLNQDANIYEIGIEWEPVAQVATVGLA